MSLNSPIKELLQTLSRHADLVEQALSGVVGVGDDTPAASIVALRQVSALRPVGEDGYRLHSQLREYVNDYLQIYPAMQSLADIGSKARRINELWDSMLDARGDRESTEALIQAMRTTILDIGDDMDRNMMLLQTLMSTRYGNVRTMAAKKQQNNWYQLRTKDLARDVGYMGRVAETVEKQSLSRGVDELSSFLRRYILSRMTPWTQAITEIQTFLRSEFNRLREIEQDMRLLSRTDMLLRQQPGWRGFELALGETVPAFLLAARLRPVSASVEPLDTDRLISMEVQEIARSLPPKSVPKVVEPPRRYKLVVDEHKPKPRAPGMLALGRLMRQVQASEEGISLLAWRKTDTDARIIPSGIWLVMAIAWLHTEKMDVRLIYNPSREGERFAHTFRDATAHRRAARAGTPSPAKAA